MHRSQGMAYDKKDNLENMETFGSEHKGVEANVEALHVTKKRQQWRFQSTITLKVGFVDNRVVV